MDINFAPGSYFRNESLFPLVFLSFLSFIVFIVWAGFSFAVLFFFILCISSANAFISLSIYYTSKLGVLANNGVGGLYKLVGNNF